MVEEIAAAATIAAWTLEDFKHEAQTYAEEVLNVITHGVGFLISIPAVYILIRLARLHGNRWHVIACALYGFTLMMMYLCSTLYHWSGIADISEGAKVLFRDLDHCAIYFLIAGTYTPLTLINLIHNNLNSAEIRKAKNFIDRRIHLLGWFILIVIWGMATGGVSLKLVYGAKNVHPFFATGFYLLMGWVGVVAARPFIKHMPRNAIRLLVAGGLSYTVGVIFLVSDTMPFNHPVWHLFVSGGTIFHYLCVMASCIPIMKSSSWKMMENKSAILSWFSRFVQTTLS